MPKQNRDRIFVSYSHKDKEWLDKFNAVLAPDIRNDRVDYWDDHELRPGDQWYSKILDGISTARVAVLLVSPNFFDSRFIMEEELPRILSACDDGLTIIWVPLFGAFFGPNAPPQLKILTDLQAAFDAGKPLAEQEPASQTKLLLDLCRNIQRLLNPGRVVCNLPFTSLSKLFKGRDEALDQLDRSLREQGSAAIVQPQAIHGLGGIGKTRLAIEYAWQHQDDFTAFLFVSANTPDDLDRNVAALCRPDCLDLRESQAPKQDEQRDAVIRWLQQNRGWLLILDNVDTDEGVRAVKTLVAKLRGGNVLITSRVTEWGRGVHPLALDVISLDDAVALLLESAHGWRAPQQEDATEARMLAEGLDCLPLALTHATAYMQHHHQGFKEYLKDFDCHFERILDYVDNIAIEYETDLTEEGKAPAKPEAMATHKKIVKTLATTFFLSFDRLTPEAKAVLETTAFLAPAPISMAMFEQSPKEMAAIVDLWCAENNEAKTGQTVADALAALARYSLVSRNEGGLFSVHRILQQKIIQRRIPAEKRETWAQGVALLIAKGAPSVNPHEPATWLGWEGLQPHAEHVWAAIKNSQQACEVASLPQALGLLFYGKGLYSRGALYAQQGLSLYEASRGPNATLTLLSLSNLADLLYKLMMYEDAERLFRRVVDASADVLGKLNPDTLMRRNGLALCVEMKNGFSASEPMYRSALEDARSALGEDHPVTLDITDNFAGSLLERGEYSRAESMFRRILAGRQRVLGENHWQTCVTMNNLAATLSSLGNTSEAEQLYRSALKFLENSVGPDHMDYVLTMANLASVLEKRDDLESAEGFYWRVLETRVRVSGIEHPRTLSALQHLAAILSRKGDLIGATQLIRRTLSLRVGELKLEHSSTVALVRELGNLLYQLGDDAGAEPLDRKLAEDIERRLGPEHFEVAQAWHDFACTLRNLGRAAEAETILRRALAIVGNTRKALPAWDPVIVHWKTDFVSALLMQDKLVEAGRIIVECWQTYGGSKDLTAARLLLVRAVLALLLNQPCSHFFGQLKLLLTDAPLRAAQGTPAIWRAPGFLTNVQSRLIRHAAELSALFIALNDPTKASSLEQFPEWREQAIVPLDAPWPDSPLTHTPTEAV